MRLIARLRCSPPVAIIATVAVLAMVVTAPQVHAAAYKKCGLSESVQQPASGTPTYNLALKQQRTTCATAKKVAAAFHKCRARTGVTCTRRLLAHWTCAGKQSSSTPVLFYATFTCRWGVRRVLSSYQQNT